MKKTSMLTFLAISSAISFGALAAEGSAKDAPVGGTFKRLDANGDGKVDFSEAQSDPNLIGRFSNVDKNNDGVITVEEVRAYDESFKSGKSKK